ncbi:DUF4412 domain-containing protein [Fluviicola taffensis]|uniref:DUF4412 domain-containing protein n=1 Tax=Fluviicola taffensis (strain DSM 16823 / NCIMB 13979 / RW262) TaxID=755732 RepID=F2IAE4_FLUTR|nr:DUF4412 domain-containing protein [Fluviicola taffensis]AEA42079.1 hypothetical protein Fluta_0069 [Fluviicola taffensis DSM 16823]
MKIVLVAFVLVFSILGVYGQEGLIKSIGKTAQEKANAQDFNTTRNNKERGNLQQENKKSSESQGAPAPASPPPAESEAPVEPSGDYQASYTFSSTVTYQMENLKKAGEVQEVTYNFGEQVIKMQPKNQDMSSVIDSKNGVMILLNDKDKTATVMSTKMMEMAMQQQNMSQGSTDKPASKVTKTGRTKTILGYKCEEVIIESEGKKTETWITRETGVDAGNIFSKMARGSVQVPNEAFNGGGMLMEMTAFDAEGKAETKMTMTAFSKESKIVNIGAYKITKL